MKKIVIGITGASGSIYAKRLIEELLKAEFKVHIICTNNGRQVFFYELGIELEKWIEEIKKEYADVVLEKINNLFSGVASGSHPFEAVVVVPCSMGTLGEMSHGLGKNLLTRSVDVALKEGRKVVIVPRETPLHTIHLENMVTLSKVGATILPAVPGFYHHPQSMEDLVDFVVGKILDYLKVENNLFKKWEGKS